VITSHTGHATIVTWRHAAVRKATFAYLDAVVGIVLHSLMAATGVELAADNLPLSHLIIF